MKKFFSLVICIMALLFAACEEHNAPATANKVKTGAASDITMESVVLHGVVNVDTSQYDDVEFGMMISEVKDDLNRDGEMYKANVLIGKDFELTIDWLSPETKYYYRAWVFLNNTQYEFGVIKEFTTLEQKIDGIGKFSVSDSKQVTFSQGNLQYTQSTNTWSFAENQYDYIGTDNVTGGDVTSDPAMGDSKSGAGLADKVDLFGWSTSATNFGVSTSTNENDYSGSFVDWGRNKIGNDAPNTWRTLTKDEWYYLLHTRTNAREDLRARDLRGLAQVNGVNGLILLPDNWIRPAGVSFKSGYPSEYSVEAYGQYQTFTAEQWSKLESAGAVFLPAAGSRNGSTVSGVQSYGRYCSATEDFDLSNYMYYLEFYSRDVYMSSSNRTFGRSVRLVKDL